MGKRAQAKYEGEAGRWMPQLVLALASACLVPAHGATGAQDSAGEAPALQVSRHRNGAGLEERIRTLSKALDLDARQQNKLRNVLESQREQIRRVWRDRSVPAAQRVSATRAINDQTGDRIRALLNEEQRKKYNPARPLHEVAAGSTQRSVEDWMNAAKPK